MKKNSKKANSRKAEWKQKPAITVGIDLGDRHSHYCVLNEDGEVIEEGRIATTEVALRRQLEGEPRQRIAMECGTHSPWVSRLLKKLGHQVIVANARQIPALTGSDPRMIAMMPRTWPGLRTPIRNC